MDDRNWLRRTIGIAILLGIPGCDLIPGLQPDGFVSDNPFGSGQKIDIDGPLRAAGAPEQDEAEGMGREIMEADIVAVEGDRLYALSEFGGLSVVDVSDPAELPLLGRYRSRGRPFEMYVEGTTVFAMFNDFAAYRWDADEGRFVWETSSRLVALDTTDPAEVRVIAEFDLPGMIQDSRRVGEILYLVTHEDASCWGCQDEPNTTVTSLSIDDLTEIEIVDQLSLPVPEEAESWGWSGQRSVMSTDERLYIASLEFTAEGGESDITIVDITDPAGDLELGDTIEVAGTITNRWQMDEYEGVLRVVSQFGMWGPPDAPILQTFRIESATQVERLAALVLTLPRPEMLQAVRFDGPRGYVVTFERLDPLFTLDLSDPEQPAQVGEIEIPGWIYHIEPRGDQLLALGFDPGNAEGSINVSLFDVENLANPELEARVNFGGDWASFGEDQNRIQKAFTILEEQNLVLVPFIGWFQEANEGCGATLSGFQLIEFTLGSKGSQQQGKQQQDPDDVAGTLELRGVAQTLGRARRALVLEGILLTVSDFVLESFDISNLDQPQSLDSLRLANIIDKVAVDGDIMARISRDPFSYGAALEIVNVANAEDPQALGRLPLSVLEGVVEQDVQQCYELGLYDVDLFVQRNYVYIVRDQYDYENWPQGNTKIDVISIEDPARPVYITTATMPFLREAYFDNIGVITPEQRALLLQDTLVLVRQNWDEDYAQRIGAFEFIDLSNPELPVHISTIDRPESLGYGGLLQFESTLVSWHMRAANATGSRVRFYLDRIDITDPAAPSIAEPVNVPGAVVTYEPSTGRATTHDFRLQAVALDQTACFQQPQVFDYIPQTGMCRLQRRPIGLLQLQDGFATLLQRLNVQGPDGLLRGIGGSLEAIFAHVRRGSFIYDDLTGEVLQVPTNEVEVITEAGPMNRLAIQAEVEIEPGDLWYREFLVEGARLAFETMARLIVVDATTPAAPELQIEPIFGFACFDLELSGAEAYCAMNEYGLQSVELMN